MNCLRVMLALEVVLAASVEGTTMVFDEVDAGVGGRAAVQIGRRLARLARTHQVIVVTHLPQVAAYADIHLVVDSAAGTTPAVSVDSMTMTASPSSPGCSPDSATPTAAGRMPASCSVRRRRTAHRSHKPVACVTKS